MRSHGSRTTSGQRRTSPPPPSIASLLAVRDVVPTAPVLRVRGLSVEFMIDGCVARAVDSVDIDIQVGETLALVGESGCGKTMTALSILGLNPPASLVRGSIEFAGHQVIGRSARELRSLRGAGVAMVFQEPVSSLNPVMRIGDQIVAALRAHRVISRTDARQRAVELLTGVGIPDAEVRVRQYPHQWSGGMCQRAMIAMALANEPALLVADEPTTALDVTVQAQILELFRTACRDTGASVLIITHDLGVVAEIADRVAVMYAGRIVEEDLTAALLRGPSHPYTVGLIESLPTVDCRRSLRAVPGRPPELGARPSGCAFHPRCTVGCDAQRCCDDEPMLARSDGTQASVACHFPNRLSVTLGRAETGATAKQIEPARAAMPLLDVQDLVVRFPMRHGSFGRVTGWLEAVRGVSFAVRPGETFGLVGESGCGKSTIAHAIARLVDPASGGIRLEGNDLVGLSGAALRKVRRDVQLVFQDPHASLDPKMSIADSVAEPLLIHGLLPRSDIPDRLAQLWDLVGISTDQAERFPHEFSGGQLQRVNIARALAAEPKLLILDEPVSSLDVSIQAQILSLLEGLQDRLGLTYLFISHDLSVVRHLADRVAVMYLGRIVETGATADLFRAPDHPYTRSLIDAVPRIDSTTTDRVTLRGEAPSPIRPPTGCGFRTRCWKATDECARTRPQLVERTQPDRLTACHFPLVTNGDALGDESQVADQGHREVRRPTG